MVLIYITAATSRAHYIFRLYFEDLLGTRYSVTDSPEEFLAFDGPRTWYSAELREKEICIRPEPLLWKKDMINFPVGISEYEGIPVLFPNEAAGWSLPFDPFTAGFYMVTRLEEHGSFRGDRFGRYRPEESIASRGKFLRRPVVNLWAELLRNLLLKRYPRMTFEKKSFRFVPTIDIDHAFAFGHRSYSRNIGGITRDIGNGDFKNLLLRVKVMLGKAMDPYDNYELLHQIHEKYGTRAVWFVLFADYGRNDNNVSLKNKRFRKLVKELSRRADVGIHPSLASNRETSLLKREVNRMAHVIDRRVINSRQHFLKFSFPKTFRNLIRIEIQQDFSMGYASEPGFRAGIADPFRFFDLSENEETELVIHPVALMDVTMRDYLKLDAEQARKMIREVIGTVKAVNGEFVSLWHNESLSDRGRWKGWRSVYEEMVAVATGK